MVAGKGAKVTPPATRKQQKSKGVRGLAQSRPPGEDPLSAKVFMLSQTSTQPSPAAENSFAALFEESLSRQEMRIGEVITAEVISVDPNVVIVNAGLKSESTIATE
jgi:hypothetical protein